MARLLVVELVVTPLGTAKTGLSDYIARAVQAVKASGVKYQVCPTSTVFEAEDLETAFRVAKAAHEAVLATGVKRVLTTLRVDDRLDQPKSMEERVKRGSRKGKVIA
ncbi:MAG: MTH1187 family thiamine-binding protein [Candidatus Hodarchaeaceae archaeon]|nr:MTH1187 family thiamine-binding protein [Candidatus Hodarchaeaceae archaeon]